MRQHEELPRLLRRLRRPAQRPRPHLTPGCPFGEEVARRLDGLEQGLQDLRGRFLWLLLWLSGAVAAEILLRLVRE
ncbi:MAG: hypothetical protein AAB270_03520 [Chloroflexota bacterium]